MLVSKDTYVANVASILKKIFTKYFLFFPCDIFIYFYFFSIGHESGRVHRELSLSVVLSWFKIRLVHADAK